MAEIPILDLPHYPDDRTEWLEGLSNNLGVLALSAKVSTTPRPIVSLSTEREHFDRDVALLRELVEKTNDLVGDPEQRRLERFDVQRAEDQCLRFPHETAREDQQMPEISRAEMIRRLDDASKDVLEQLTNGPLGADERHALARSLVRLLPVVADDLQGREQKEAADKLLEHLQRWEVEAESSGRLDVVDAKMPRGEAPARPK